MCSLNNLYLFNSKRVPWFFFLQSCNLITLVLHENTDFLSQLMNIEFIDYKQHHQGEFNEIV